MSDEKPASAITANALRREIKLERWDRDRVYVMVQLPDGSFADVIGVDERLDRFVMITAPAAAD